MEQIEKIDKIRERFNVSYEKASAVLEEVEGDLIQALIKLEKAETNQQKNQKEDQTLEDNIYKVKGRELIKKIKQLIKEGNISKISVQNSDGDTLIEIPVTAGVVSLVLFPYISILAGLAALYKEYTLKIVRNKKQENEVKNEKEKDEEYYPFD